MSRSENGNYVRFQLEAEQMSANLDASREFPIQIAIDCLFIIAKRSIYIVLAMHSQQRRRHVSSCSTQTQVDMRAECKYRLNILCK